MDVYSVTGINTLISSLIDEVPTFRSLYVKGEISNFKYYSQKKQAYFTLKDASSQIRGVMFADLEKTIGFIPEDGMSVICSGKISVYMRDGNYQLKCFDMQPNGVGTLAIAYEQLKKKLEKEGLFSDFYKKEIPHYPHKIGVATSATGAAVEDIKNVITRRYPLCDIIIAPTIVQGEAAAPDIVKSIETLDNMGDIDVIIVGRGGGSIEDLWAFNTEIVARAVFKCKTPVISAVGHETDFTICDFVSDMRAPTPSAAAEIAVPDIENERQMFLSLKNNLDYLVERKLERCENEVKVLREGTALGDIDLFFSQHHDRISDYNEKISSKFTLLLEKKEGAFKSAVSALNALSPLAVISRGYSVVSSKGSVVKSANSLKAGDRIEIKYPDGRVNATVDEVENYEQ